MSQPECKGRLIDVAEDHGLDHAELVVDPAMCTTVDDIPMHDALAENNEDCMTITALYIAGDGLMWNR